MKDDLDLNYAQKNYLFSPEEKISGFSYPEWTVKWWQWLISIPAKSSPVLAEDDKNVAIKQNGPMWFLAGTLGQKVVTRKCTIPSDKYVMFPIINSIHSSSIRKKLTEAELRVIVKSQIDQITKMNFTFSKNGNKTELLSKRFKDLKKYRIQSLLFNIRFPDNNIFNLQPRYTIAVSDGYWIILSPLSAGNYELKFEAEISFDFKQEVTYNITVSDRPIKYMT